MTSTWFVLSLVAPPVAAIVAGIIFRHREPPPAVTVALNFLLPGSGPAETDRLVFGNETSLAESRMIRNHPEVAMARSQRMQKAAGRRR